MLYRMEVNKIYDMGRAIQEAFIWINFCQIKKMGNKSVNVENLLP